MTTLVLLPGMDGTGALFEPFLRQLPSSTQAKVITYPRSERLGYEELTRLVVSSLPSEGDLFVLGESFSGPVAIATAARAASRLRGLILACSFASNPLPALKHLRHLVAIAPPPSVMLAPLSFALMGKHATPALRQALATALQSVDPAVLRHRASAALSIDATANLAQLKSPVLYLQATQDRVVPSGCASKVQLSCPQVEVIRLVGPHFLLQTQPAAAAAAIESFMRRAQNAA